MAKGADELAWLAFETKMRDLMRRVMQPVIAMCIEDREVMFGIEQKESDTLKRLDLLEGAVFKKNGKIGRNIFDDYDDKLAHIDYYLKNETLRLDHRITENMTVFDERFFVQDSKVQQVLAMGKQIDLIMGDIEALKKNNQEFSESLMEDMEKFKKVTIDEFKLQQKQISMSREKIDSIFNNLTSLGADYDETKGIVKFQRELLA